MARMASVAAACQQVTHIIKPEANHGFTVAPGDDTSAGTSEITPARARLATGAAAEIKQVGQ